MTTRTAVARVLYLGLAVLVAVALVVQVVLIVQGGADVNSGGPVRWHRSAPGSCG